MGFKSQRLEKPCLDLPTTKAVRAELGARRKTCMHMQRAQSCICWLVCRILIQHNKPLLMICSFCFLISRCSRLGLSSLAYLWRRDQSELLSEMISAGIEAVLIKVAAMGMQACYIFPKKKRFYKQFFFTILTLLTILISLMSQLYTTSTKDTLPTQLIISCSTLYCNYNYFLCDKHFITS